LFEDTRVAFEAITHFKKLSALGSRSLHHPASGALISTLVRVIFFICLILPNAGAPPGLVPDPQSSFLPTNAPI